METLEIEDFYRDFVVMSFNQHDSTVVLDMMRSMSYLPNMGLVGASTGLVSSWPSLIMMYHSDSDLSPLRLIIDIWRVCPRSG